MRALGGETLTTAPTPTRVWQGAAQGQEVPCTCVRHTPRSPARSCMRAQVPDHPEHKRHRPAHPPGTGQRLRHWYAGKSPCHMCTRSACRAIQQGTRMRASPQTSWTRASTPSSRPWTPSLAGTEVVVLKSDALAPCKDRDPTTMGRHCLRLAVTGLSLPFLPNFFAPAAVEQLPEPLVPGLRIDNEQCRELRPPQPASQLRAVAPCCWGVARRFPQPVP